jgi:hypothetical protein
MLKSWFKNILILCLLAGVSTPHVVLHQLLKIPVLFSHYLHHATEHDEAGLLTFIQLHYGDSKHMEDDADEHKHLPGNSNHTCKYEQVVPVFHAQSPISIIVPELYTNQPYSNYIERIPQCRLNSIWQPPKYS